MHENRVALVTGGSRGIGRALSLELAKNGIFVYINYLSNEAAALETAQHIHDSGFQCKILRFDVTKKEEVKSAVETIITEHGRIDILINNAGIALDGLIVRFSEDNWQKLFDVNLKAVFLTSQAVTKSMMKNQSGKIINIGSVVGQMGNAGQSAYSASKSALEGLTKSLAKELASRNIQVNMVSPGYIETEMTQGLSEKNKELLLQSIPLQRIGKPEEVAKLVCFLVSEHAQYITGQNIAINGGLYM